MLKAFKNYLEHAAHHRTHHDRPINIPMGPNLGVKFMVMEPTKWPAETAPTANVALAAFGQAYPKIHLMIAKGNRQAGGGGREADVTVCFTGSALDCPGFYFTQVSDQARQQEEDG